MTFCAACGAEAPAGGGTCPSCGAPTGAKRPRRIGFPAPPSWLALLWIAAILAALAAILVVAFARESANHSRPASAGRGGAGSPRKPPMPEPFDLVACPKCLRPRFVGTRPLQTRLASLQWMRRLSSEDAARAALGARTERRQRATGGDWPATAEEREGIS